MPDPAPSRPWTPWPGGATSTAARSHHPDHLRPGGTVLMPVDTPAWARDAVFYQIFPDRFASSARVAKPGPLEAWNSPPTHQGFKGGDLLGIVEHLDYLTDLGVNALYLNPIFASAS